MASDAVIYNRRLRKQAALRNAFSRPHYLRRVRHVIERTDWEELILAQEEWVDRMCIGVIVVAALYFVPPVLTILFLS